MNEKVQVIFGLVGGLALFLYGMNSMSDAMQKAAGEKNEEAAGSDHRLYIQNVCRR